MATRPSICDGGGDRRGRAVLLGDVVLLDEALGEGLIAEGALRDVLDDLVDLHALGVVVGFVLDAADVRAQGIGRDGANEHGRDQDQRSTRAHTHLFSDWTFRRVGRTLARPLALNRGRPPIPR